MNWIERFQHRVDEPEWMDQPYISRQEFEEALHDIQWINRNLSGASTLIQAVETLIDDLPQKRFTVLDLGTGSADIPMALVRWGRSQGIRFEVIAVDVHPIAVEVGRKLASEYPEITVIPGDALRLDYPDQSFDLVTCSMFLHHLSEDDGVALLQEMYRMSRLGFVVNDLERHPAAWLGVKVLGKLLGMGKVFQNDAPLSVLRGFTMEDVLRLKVMSGIGDLQISRQAPFRVVLTHQKTAPLKRYASKPLP